MKIQRVILLKTPLDNSYTNVIDFVNNEPRKDTLVRVLTENYNFKSINGLSRSIKRVGNSTLLVLPISYEEGRQYNYLYIKDIHENYYFYFITSVTSENDNTENPSCIMTLEWDAWNNNIDKFKDVPNTILYRHYPRFNYDKEDRLFKPNFIVNNCNIDIPRYSKEHIQMHRYIPAFFVLNLKEMNKFYINSRYPNIKDILRFPIVFENEYRESVLEEINVVVCDSVNNKYNRNVVYWLAGVYDIKEEKFVQCYVTNKKFRVSFSGEPYIYIEDKTFKELSQPRLSIFPKLTPYISDITMSFHSPFEYIISIDDENRIILDFPENYIIECNDFPADDTEGYSTSDTKQFAIIGDLYIDSDRFTTSGKEIRLPTRTGSPYYLSISYDVVTEYFQNVDARSIISIDKIDDIDPITYTPPFTSVYLTYNNENLILFPISKNSYKFDIITDNSSPQPNFIVLNDGKRYRSESRKYIKNSGFFSFGVDSLANFKAKNDGKLELDNISKGLSLIFNMTRFANTLNFTQGLEGATKNVLGVYGNEVIALADADRTPDSWVTNSGECDLKYQDRIRIIVEKCDKNNPIYKEFMNTVYLYGYQFTSIDSPFSNSRLDFDYVQTSECNLSSLKLNSEDTKKLESIFNRGVTKWHLTNNANGMLSFNSDMIKDKTLVKNLEIFTETDPVVNNLLYGN